MLGSNLNEMYPRANPIPEHHTETMSRTMHNYLSFAANVRRWKAGYVMRHRTVRIVIRGKFGLSKPALIVAAICPQTGRPPWVVVRRVWLDPR